MSGNIKDNRCSKCNSEMDNNVCSHCGYEQKEIDQKIPFPIIRTLVELYYDYQHVRIITSNRIAGNVRSGLMSEDSLEEYNVNTIFNQTRKLEKDIQKELAKQIKHYDLCSEYLTNIYGIAEILSSGIMAYISDVGKFRNVSSLWQYAGLGMNTFCEDCQKPTYVNIEYNGKAGKVVAKRLRPMKICNMCDGTNLLFIRQKRTAGFQSNYNDKFKTLCWKISNSFVKQSATKSGFRCLYDDFKIHERTKHPIKIVKNGKTMYNDGHIHNMVLRKISKIFLSHVWTIWRTIEGLPVTAPYESQVLGHAIVDPFVDKIPEGGFKYGLKLYDNYAKDTIGDDTEKVGNSFLEEPEDF